jgi:sortase B
MKNKIILKIILIMCIGVILYNSYVLVNWFIDRNKLKKEVAEIDKILEIKEVTETENIVEINPPETPNDEESTEVNDYWNYIKMPLIDVNIEDLKKVNSDTVGFLAVNGTNINYPVVQTTDNNYYLKHSFKKASSVAGWVFMDYRNNANNLGKNTIIYAHKMTDGTMFGTLKNILKSGWLNNKNNYIINLSTENKNTLWQVFSTYVTNDLSYYIKTEFKDDSEYNTWLQEMVRRSEYNFNTLVNEKSQILTLSTCYGPSADNRRIVMHAKLIKTD